jgi:hypothetical protein
MVNSQAHYENQGIPKTLDIPVPDDTPPISVLSGDHTDIYAPPELYRGNIAVSEDALQNGDFRRCTEDYVAYVTYVLLGMNVKKTADDLDLVKFSFAITMERYLNASFWNQDYPLTGGWWTTPLWYLREHMGSAYVDKISAYALRSVADNPSEGHVEKGRGHTDIYICNHLRIGAQVVDGGLRWKEITNNLRTLNPEYSKACEFTPPS